MKKNLHRWAESDFLRFGHSELSLLSGLLSKSSIDNRRTALRSLGRFAGGVLPFRLLTPLLVCDYCRWLRRHGVCENTVRAYCRSLRAVYNRAVSRRVTPDRRPFSGVPTGSVRTAKRAVGMSDVARLSRAEVRPGWQSLALDLFMFSFLCGGMPAVDMAFLRWDQIDPSLRRLTYSRRKTGRPVTLELLPEARSILSRYRRPGGGGYVFPLVRSADPSLAMREYEGSLGQYNRALRLIGLRVGLPRLTSYVSRHTWASCAHHRFRVPTSAIARAQGHSSERTTEVYISDIDDGQVFRAQRRVRQGLRAEGMKEASAYSG